MGIFTGQINIDSIQTILSNDILPKIGEGITLTKDYMLELGGRYIQYEIILNAGIILISILAIFLGYKFVRFVLKDVEKYRELEDKKKPKGCCNQPMVRAEAHRYYLVFAIAAVIVGIMGVVNLIESVGGILQWILVPEIKIFAKLLALKAGMGI